MAFDRVGDPDTADQQRGQSDQGEVLREPLDIALERGRGIVARADFPAGCGQLRPRRRDHGGGRALALVGQLELIVPAHQAARLQQAGRAQRRLAHDQPRAERDPARELVRLAFEHGGKLDRGRAERQPRPGRQLKPRQQRRIDCRAIDPIAFRERIRKRDVAVERDRAIERIGRVHGLDLDQRAASVRRARHRPHGRCDRDLALAVEKRALGRARLALDERKGEIAAQDRAAFARQALGQAFRKRSDARDRHHAQRDAGDENKKPAQTGTQFAQRKFKRKQGRAAGQSNAHARAFMLSLSILPERSRTMRSQRCASAASWVTSTSVVPRSLWLSNSRSMMF